MSNWLGFDRGISQAISDWVQLSGILTDCWWRQRKRERLEDRARENCKGKKSINLKFVSDQWLSNWYMTGLHFFLYGVFPWWYVFEYSLYPKLSAMFWLDWPPCRQLKHKMPSQASSTGWLVYNNEWTRRILTMSNNLQFQQPWWYSPKFRNTLNVMIILKAIGLGRQCLKLFSANWEVTINEFELTLLKGNLLQLTMMTWTLAYFKGWKYTQSKSNLGSFIQGFP